MTRAGRRLVGERSLYLDVIGIDHPVVPRAQTTVVMTDTTPFHTGREAIATRQRTAVLLPPLPDDTAI